MIPTTLRQLPSPNVPLVNQDGTIAKAWYDYFRELDARTRALITASNDHETRITTLEP